MYSALICPHCSAPLIREGTRLTCHAQHSFDQARQGYWNLLPVQNKRSKDPGDNAIMVAARRQFLDTGHYQPLSDQLNQLLAAQLAMVASPAIVDIGCGEGYYSARLKQQLPASILTGIDISKHAVKAACRRHRGICWLVASGAQPPLAPGSQHAALVLFSRLMPEALHTLLAPKGVLLLAWPGGNHLIELRKALYETLRPSSYQPENLLSPLFSQYSLHTLEHSFTLSDTTNISNLLAMTPHSHKAPVERRQALLARKELTLSFHVHLGLFTRNPT